MSDAEPISESTAKRISLPLLLLWGLSPAIAMTLLSLAMKLNPTNDPSLFILLQLIVTPVVLLIWAVWVVRHTSWGTGTRVLAGLLFFVLAYAVNTVIAAGACSVIDPPFNMH